MEEADSHKMAEKHGSVGAAVSVMVLHLTSNSGVKGLILQLSGLSNETLN